MRISYFLRSALALLIVVWLLIGVNQASAQALLEEISPPPPVSWQIATNDEGAGDDLLYETKEAACQASIQQTAAFLAQYGEAPPTYVSTDPVALHSAWNIAFQDDDGKIYPRLGASCNDHSHQDFALPVCPEGFDVTIDKAGSGLSCTASVELSECEACEPGATPLAQAPLPTVGNPISIEGGVKVQSEVDYTTADGLLRVERTYRSARPYGHERDVAANTPGFGPSWHGLYLGRLIAIGRKMESLVFTSDKGVTTVFSASTADVASWTYSTDDSTRLQLAMMAIPVVNREQYYEDGAANVAAQGEVKVSFSNGDYLIFRRSGEYDPSQNTRALVPVERGFTSGYRLFFEYPDADQYPNRIRDSFGRQLALTWADAGWTGDVPPIVAQPKKIAELALPDGSRLIYNYGPPASVPGFHNRLDGVQHLDANGQIVWGRSYFYEDGRFPLALTGVADKEGARLATYSYSAAGLAASTERSAGVNRWSVVYLRNAENHNIEVRRVTNPLGRVEDYTFERPTADGTAAPRKLRRIEGHATPTVAADSQEFTYTGDQLLPNANPDLLASVTDRNGHRLSSEIDMVNKRPASTTDAAGNTWHIEWHPQLDLPQRMVQFGKVAIEYTYDDAGRMLSQKLVDQSAENGAAARTITYTWGAGGRLTSVNGPRWPLPDNGGDDVTNFTYDAQGNRLTMTNALGHITSYSGYDLNGRPGEMVDPNGVKTLFAYDPLGRIRTATVKHPSNAALDAVTAFEYDNEGRVVGLVRPATARLSFDYDPAGRLLAIRSDDGERIDYTYDAMSNALSETVRRADGTAARGIARTFDSLGRLLTETLGPGRTTSWSYDANGNAIQIVSPRGHATTQGFDALDRLVTQAAPAAGTTTTDYDGLGDATSFSDANAVTTQFVRNGLGDVVQEISPDRGTTTYTYDEAGNMTSKTDARGVTVYYEYDLLGRLIYKEPSDNPANAVHYDWDQPDTETTWRIGRLTQMRDGTGLTIYNYDHRGNLTAQRQRLVGTSEWIWLRYSYDLADRIHSITYPSGRQVLYGRDAKGRVLSIKTRANTAVAIWTNLATGMTYEPFGPLRAMQLGNGLRSVADRGDDGRLASRRLYRLADGANLSRLTYGYDADDNIVRITDTLDSTKTLKYGYDEAGRVNRLDVASGPVQRIVYANDNNGNRLRQVNRALPTDTVPLSTDTYAYTPGTNRLASVRTGTGASAPTRTIQYDARGNTASESRPGGEGVATAYDGYGRLTGYTRGAEVLSFQYNGGDDRVVMASSSAGVRRFVYDPDGRVLGEYGNGASDVKAEFIWLSPAVANDNAFGGDDGIGGYAPLAVATPDLLGSVQLNWVHPNHLGVPLVTTDSSGNPAATPNDYLAPGFPGQSRVLPDLYYNRHRDYDPATGRYIQADPIGLAGGGNPYAYVGGNPVNFVDPLGLGPLGATIGGVVGGQVGSSVGGRAGGAVGGPGGAVAGGVLGGIGGRAAGRRIGSAVEDAIRNCFDDDDGDVCYSRWNREHSKCSQWSYLGPRAVQACRSRAAYRRNLCVANRGRPNPSEPPEWDPWKDWFGEQDDIDP